jgi:ribosomal protein L11 methyltransferase
VNSRGLRPPEVVARRKRQPPGPEPAPWRRATIDVAAAAADAVSGLLLDVGALGLEVEDDETRAVPGRALMPTGRALVLATFPREKGLEARVMKSVVALAVHVPEAHDVVVEWSDLYAEDWNEVFRSQWKPFVLGTKVHIVPSWERDAYVVPPGGVPLYLDPGMAFGTGTHETTQLCCEAVEATAPTAQHVLDVGTGSGILCILALKLGAAKATGTDIDPVALSAARENAANNGVGDRFATRDSLPDAHGAIHDVVYANILAGTLIELASSIVGAAAPGAALFLSGVLTDQAPAVVDAFVKAGTRHVRTVEKNGWVRIDLAR